MFSSMMGFGEEAGVIPRFCEELFSRLSRTETKEVTAPYDDCSFIIYDWIINTACLTRFIYIVDLLPSGDELFWGVQWENPRFAGGTGWTQPEENACKCNSSVKHIKCYKCLVVYLSSLLICSAIQSFSCLFQLRVREHPVYGPYVADLST